MEQYSPKAICRGVPIVWVRCAYWEDEVWEGMCAWCGRFSSAVGFAGTGPMARKIANSPMTWRPR
jgi:hypothetical protein